MRSALGLLRLLMHLDGGRADCVYEFLGTKNNLAEKSLYLNLGYWKDATTYDTACEALAELLGEAAGMKAGDVVVDAGCGFADQDMFWCRKFGVGKIIGINITERHVQHGRERVKAAGLEARIELVRGSATELSVVPAESVDKVVALESAFHFKTRETFLLEAYRVLKPGGMIALADLVVASAGRDKAGTVAQKLANAVGQVAWQIPQVNLYGADVYREKMEAAGFVDCKVDVISEWVFKPFREFAKKRIQEREVRERLHPLVRMMWSADHAQKYDGQPQTLDYVIAVGRKI